FFHFASVMSLHAPFLFIHTPFTAIYTLSLHDALPICFLGRRSNRGHLQRGNLGAGVGPIRQRLGLAFLDPLGGAARTLHKNRSVDRKSTRLNSSHVKISYAVFCLKKEKKKHIQELTIE